MRAQTCGGRSSSSSSSNNISSICLSLLASLGEDYSRMHLLALLSIQARPAKLHFWAMFADGEFKIPKLHTSRSNSGFGSNWLLVKPIAQPMAQ